MKLHLDPGLGVGYASRSQWARRVTEGWAGENLYCVACPADRLRTHDANRAVEDYQCMNCGRQVQLKAKNGAIGRTVSNSAFAKKQAAILTSKAPDYCFMSYDRADLTVDDILWVPGHFMTLSVISKRKPLRAEAKRAGWVGSNIHLDRIPEQGKIPVVIDGRIRPCKEVRTQFLQTAFLQSAMPEARGWLADVLACLDHLEIRRGARFTNGDVYSCSERLRKLHPENRHVDDKIRQQLQVLARHGLVRRLQPGIYERS